jgi:serine phosphatase RsbU (regulator of sigma subunit)
MAKAEPKRFQPDAPAGKDFLRLVWKAPLFALPFAFFFLITTGAPLRTFRDFYIVSLAFAFASFVGVWFARHFVSPAISERIPDDPRRTWKLSAVHAVMALVSCSVVAVLLHFTIAPGFLGSGRAVLTLIIYFALFGVLSVGLVLASRFYRAAVERAGSERELMLARRIQESFLLSEFPRRSRLEVYATNVSSKEVSGDFYDVVPVGEDGYLLAVADVSGKGVPAALLTAMLQASLRTQASAGVRVSAMMETINRLVCGRAVTGQFATFFLAAVSERDMTLRFTNAGHNFPYLFRTSGERKALETGGLVVGMMDDARYQEECVALAPGDRVLFYTDGVTEAARPDQEMFGEERLIRLVESLPRDLAACEVVDRVLEGVRDFLGETEAGDDITVMVLRVMG